MLMLLVKLHFTDQFVFKPYLFVIDSTVLIEFCHLCLNLN